MLTVQIVRFLHYADQIIVMSDNGTISEQGTFAELSKAGGYVGASAEDISIEASLDSVSADTDLKVEFASSDASAPDDAAPLDKARQIGDFNVYRYYFSFLSWKIGIAFLVLQVFYAFLMTFPSK